MTVYQKITDIPLFQYGMIMADPPWSFENWSTAGERKNAKSHYGCMSLDDIMVMPVGHLAQPNAVLFLWATNPMLREAIQVLEAWGFSYKTAGHWSKKTKNGRQCFGTGYVLRSAGEPFLIGTLGRPKTARNVRSVIEGVVREHSRKPEEAYRAAEALVPDVHRLDLFSREERPGWDCFGDEIGKFKEAAE